MQNFNQYRKSTNIVTQPGPNAPMLRARGFVHHVIGDGGGVKPQVFQTNGINVAQDVTLGTAQRSINIYPGQYAYIANKEQPTHLPTPLSFLQNSLSGQRVAAPAPQQNGDQANGAGPGKPGVPSVQADTGISGSQHIPLNTPVIVQTTANAAVAVSGAVATANTPPISIPTNMPLPTNAVSPPLQENQSGIPAAGAQIQPTQQLEVMNETGFSAQSGPSAFAGGVGIDASIANIATAQSGTIATTPTPVASIIPTVVVETDLVPPAVAVEISNSTAAEGTGQGVTPSPP